jgi:hypothetical protein
MATSESFRCYYEDGTIFTASECPTFNNDSPLIDSEFQIMQDVAAKESFPWFLIILGLVYVFSNQKGKPK